MDLDISVPESMSSTEESSTSSVKQSLLAHSLPVSTSGESIEFSSLSLTAPSFTRPTSRMLEALAMANEFHNDRAEASFRLFQIKITETTPSGRLKSFIEQLLVVLNMSARMHRSLNNMTRHHIDSLSLDNLSSMRKELSEISATRDSLEELAYKYLDAFSQPSAGMRGDSVNIDSAVPDKEEDLTTEALGTSDVAVNDAESFLELIGNLSMAFDNLGTTFHMDHTIRPSNNKERKVIYPSSITGLTNISMVKEDVNSFAWLLGQAASPPGPIDEKDYKATRFKTTLKCVDLQIVSMGFPSRDVYIMMRMLALLGSCCLHLFQDPANIFRGEKCIHFSW